MESDHGSQKFTGHEVSYNQEDRRSWQAKEIVERCPMIFLELWSCWVIGIFSIEIGRRRIDTCKRDGEFEEEKCRKNSGYL